MSDENFTNKGQLKNLAMVKFISANRNTIFFNFRFYIFEICPLGQKNLSNLLSKVMSKLDKYSRKTKSIYFQNKLMKGNFNKSKNL